MQMKSKYEINKQLELIEVMIAQLQQNNGFYATECGSQQLVLDAKNKLYMDRFLLLLELDALEILENKPSTK